MKDIVNILVDKYYSLDDHSERMEMLEDYIDEIKLLPTEILKDIVEPYHCYNIDRQKATVQNIFKIALDELCDRKVDRAIQKRGYCYYGGTKIYPTDWVKARDSFLKYYASTGDASAANTLGYIYYYGRTNNGVPEYNKAFKYFSIGNLGGSVESKYKLADMFYHGYGVKKNVELAYKTYSELYKKSLESFAEGYYWCEFADVALRLGRCFYEGEYVRNLETAYKYYLQADLAIRKRMAYNKQYGDTSVFRSIQTGLNEIRDKYFRENPKSLKYYLEDFDWIDQLLVNGRICRAIYKILKTGELQLSFKFLTNTNIYESKIPNILITIPSADYCELKEKLEIKTEGFESLYVSPDRFYLEDTDEKRSFIFTNIFYDDEEYCLDFYFYEKRVASISSDEFYFVAPKKISNPKKYHFVRIVFEGSGRTYDYLCDDLSIKAGDIVVVNTYEGEKNVNVVDVVDLTERELFLPLDRYKYIERKL